MKKESARAILAVFILALISLQIFSVLVSAQIAPNIAQAYSNTNNPISIIKQEIKSGPPAGTQLDFDIPIYTQSGEKAGDLFEAIGKTTTGLFKKDTTAEGSSWNIWNKFTGLFAQKEKGLWERWFGGISTAISTAGQMVFDFLLGIIVGIISYGIRVFRNKIEHPSLGGFIATSIGIGMIIGLVGNLTAVTYGLFYGILLLIKIPVVLWYLPLYLLSFSTGIAFVGAILAGIWAGYIDRIYSYLFGWVNVLFGKIREKGGVKGYLKHLKDGAATLEFMGRVAEGKKPKDDDFTSAGLS